MNQKNIKTYPLKSITLNQAITLQHHIVSIIAQNLESNQMLTLGDLGVRQPFNKPLTTKEVEKVVAKIFNAEAALLVTGSGTGALRWAIYSTLKKSKKVLVHQAPIYPTTKISLEYANSKIIKVDFNNLTKLRQKILANPDLDLVIVQQTRQKLDDQYDYGQVIKTIKEQNTNLKVVTDDNYAVFKTKNIGTNFGADLATFSSFKVLGPEGVGVIIGKQKLISDIKQANYSGGSQVQGWQAMELLRGMVYAPVAFAIQAQVLEKTYQYLKKQNWPIINNVYIANAQSKVLIIEFNKPIAKQVLIEAAKLGALSHPVGAESKYEITPLFYRVSHTFSQSITNPEKYFIRINPNRAGSQLIIDILTKALTSISCF